VKRRFIDASTEERCMWTTRSNVQCGRRRVLGSLICAQHQKMADRWSCEYCGGNDELPPDHCMDCTRPTPKEN
jgi:hypothetical protein